MQRFNFVRKERNHQSSTLTSLSCYLFHLMFRWLRSLAVALLMMSAVCVCVCMMRMRAAAVISESALCMHTWLTGWIQSHLLKHINQIVLQYNQVLFVIQTLFTLEVKFACGCSNPFLFFFLFFSSLPPDDCSNSILITVYFWNFICKCNLLLSDAIKCNVTPMTHLKSHNHDECERWAASSRERERERPLQLVSLSFYALAASTACVIHCLLSLSRFRSLALKQCHLFRM